MAELLTVDPAKETKKITDFIKTSVSSRGFQKVVIALSGGVDSTTAFYLAVRALSNNVYPLLLPYRNTYPEAIKDAKRAIQAAALRHLEEFHFEVIDIGPLVDAFAKVLIQGVPLPGTGGPLVRQGNIMARCRMIILYDRAKKHNALVLGTENKSEYLLSYFTRFGDEASDIEPIRHLYKTQIVKLAKYLGVPKRIIKKAPTAGLWPGQTDEAELGFSYQLADQILYRLYDQKKKVEQIIQEGFKREDVEKVKNWVETNYFKHQLPVVYQGK